MILFVCGSDRSTRGRYLSCLFNILRLIEDDVLRYHIAEAGDRNIQQFTRERAYDKLKDVLGV